MTSDEDSPLEENSGMRIRVAVVTGAHGLKGWVKVKSFTHDPAAFVEYGPLTDASGMRAYDILPKGEVKGQLLVEIKDVATREMAEAMRGTEFFARRDALPGVEEDEFLIDDLIGMQVYLTDGSLHGRIKAAYDFGAGDILEIAPLDGPDELYGFTEANFLKIDRDRRRVTLSPPEILIGERPARG